MLQRKQQFIYVPVKPHFIVFVICSTHNFFFTKEKIYPTHTQWSVHFGLPYHSTIYLICVTYGIEQENDFTFYASKWDTLIQKRNLILKATFSSTTRKY